MNAEAAYLFRHALLRDAAYQLQMPADRARLHILVVEIMEALFGGRPSMPQTEWRVRSPRSVHALDCHAAELAAHVQAAVEGGDTGAAELHSALRTYLCRAALAADNALQFADAVELWMRLADFSNGSERVDAWCKAATALFQLGRLERARELGLRARLLARELGDAKGEGAAMNVMVASDLRGKRAKEAGAHGHAVLKISKACGDLHNEAAISSKLANHYVGLGKYEVGEALDTRALQLFRSLENRRGEVTVMVNLGVIRQMQKRWSEAESQMDAALRQSRAGGFREIEATALWNLAEIHRESGRAESGLTYLRQAIALAQSVGHPLVLGMSWWKLSEIVWKQGRLEEVEAALGSAKAALDETEIPMLGEIYCQHAVCLLQLGRNAQARAQWQRGIAILQNLNQPRMIGKAQRHLEKTCTELGVPIPWE